MNAFPEIEMPAEKTKVKIDQIIRDQFCTEQEEEGQVTVHCSYTGASDLDLIRVWKTTYLFPNASATRCKLIHIENISEYPLWTAVAYGQTLHFTLFFERLPKSCNFFSLEEKIPESGGWYVKDIPRNKTDVYYVDLNEGTSQ